MTATRGDHDETPSGPSAELDAFRDTDGGFELSVRLLNPLERAVHYIADVRGIIFDTTTRHLRIQLSDQGREMPPGIIGVQPRFRTIDPQSEAILTVPLPATITKLSSDPAPPGELLFEEHAIGDAETIDVEIGWSDTPFYVDPREKSRGRQPISTWEKGLMHLQFAPAQRPESSR